MRVVILTGEQPNQAALCNKIAETIDVAAIVLSQNIPRNRPNLARRTRLFVNRIAGRTIGRRLLLAWSAMQERYAAGFPKFPSTETIRVRNVNDPETIAAIKRHSPDLVVVSGTNIVGQRIIAAACSKKGIVNMHTGISPYVKGGPNCTNWCLAKGWHHLIGNTVMWLDSGIDSGHIISTERTPLNGDESLDELHWKVMEHAHDLYLRSLLQVASGGPVRSVAQNLVAPGVTFSSIEWTGPQMWRALRNHRRYYRIHSKGRQITNNQGSHIRLFPLDEQ